jgi:hypothetical protein
MGYQLQGIKSHWQLREIARSDLRSLNRPWGLMLHDDEEEEEEEEGGRLYKVEKEGIAHL